MAKPTAGWEKLGDKFYRKIQLYTDVFDQDLELENYILTGAAYGGAIGTLVWRVSRLFWQSWLMCWDIYKSHVTDLFPFKCLLLQRPLLSLFESKVIRLHSLRNFICGVR